MSAEGPIDNFNPRTGWNVQPQDHDWRKQDKVRVHMSFQK